MAAQSEPRSMDATSPLLVMCARKGTGRSRGSKALDAAMEISASGAAECLHVIDRESAFAQVHAAISLGRRVIVVVDCDKPFFDDVAVVLNRDIQQGGAGLPLNALAGTQAGDDFYNGQGGLKVRTRTGNFTYADTSRWTVDRYRTYLQRLVAPASS